MRLSDKSAIVTGGGAGIGRAICLLFAEEGASVVVADIDETGGQETASLIADAGREATFIKTDVSDEGQVMAMVDEAASAMGKIDVLINDAAAFVFGQVEEVTDADWQKVFGVNVLGPSYCVRNVMPHMKKLGGGSIVNIASVSSFIAQPAFVPYNTSKGALLQLTRCLAMDLAPHNIRVNCVCPGSVLTQATEAHRRYTGSDRDDFLREAGASNFMKRIADPREIAYGALFLASDESSFMTGSPLIMDGGATAQ
ncbi:MAG: glucose 1-dehydrogenase [SAR202 cluster bacterium]|jgi:NAD(P)-dependent dehydrogenase (short-subunit alcohol dehydrogenase family)|nr:short-chain dehydrogenase [Chloroflexota bacterium]MDP6663921.1 glucose 1-dehydrogenase [SAR202 cluster bacterium]HAL49576.1 short-chain dehydrogenase [Dehalococcoidia bacterium]MDP6798893.1 glucose 1-dehydrogenase [SAR202 cluster bacterium]MQG59100.1 glucose 1-dehydrogenase [SAR202 cluster bacterium]|tara:strand:+ start:4676 stop:5440 length:765 start_codon:yes stop_codon:yes gene_type:complete